MVHYGSLAGNLYALRGAAERSGRERAQTTETIASADFRVPRRAIREVDTQDVRPLKP